MNIQWIEDPSIKDKDPKEKDKEKDGHASVNPKRIPAIFYEVWRDKYVIITHLYVVEGS